MAERRDPTDTTYIVKGGAEEVLGPRPRARRRSSDPGSTAESPSPVPTPPVPPRTFTPVPEKKAPTPPPATPRARNPVEEIPRRTDPRTDGSIPGAERAHGAGRDALVKRTTVPAPPPESESRVSEVRAARILEELARCGPGEEVAFAQRLIALGDVGLRALENGFPGLLWFDRRVIHQRAPAGRSVSPIASLLVARGAEALPVVARLLRREDPNHRFYATLVAADLCLPALVPSLAELIFDEDPDIHEAALSGLVALSGHDSVRLACTWVRARLLDPAFLPSRRRAAVLALTKLRDPEAVTAFVHLLDWDEQSLHHAVHEGLRVLTGHDEGSTGTAWKRWLDRHGRERRERWLVSALSGTDAALRDFVAEELSALTGRDFGYVQGMDEKAVKRVQKQAEAWLDTRQSARPIK